MMSGAFQHHNLELPERNGSLPRVHAEATGERSAIVEVSTVVDFKMPWPGGVEKLPRVGFQESNNQGINRYLRSPD
jgi:hypothetical protein